MKAWILERYGPPEGLELRELPRPEPRAGEVLVKVHAASLNDWDWGILLGDALLTRLLYGLFKPRVRVLGCDIAGRVEAVGEGTARFNPGDEVYGDLSGVGFGAFAEYACVPEHALALKPPAMTFLQAAGVPQAAMLAVQGLFDVGRFQPGQKVLLNGAGGGVGTYALQLAKREGAEVTVVDKAGKLECLRALGADHLIDFEREDFTKGEGRYDLILDVKTNRSPLAYARVLKPGGTYVTIGGSVPRLLQVLLWRPLLAKLQKKHLRLVVLKPNKDLPLVNERVAAGELVTVVDGPHPFAEAPRALRHYGSGDHVGKVILSLD